MIGSFEEADRQFTARKDCGCSSQTTSSAIQPPPPSGPTAPICSVYQVLRPILQAISPILPSNWKTSIAEFIKIMDGICPQPGVAPAQPAALVPITFEQADDLVKRALGQYYSSGSHLVSAQTLATLGSGNIGSQVCGVYKTIKPILDFISLFAPAAWKAGIVAFEAVFDVLCPSQLTSN